MVWYLINLGIVSSNVFDLKLKGFKMLWYQTNSRVSGSAELRMLSCWRPQNRMQVLMSVVMHVRAVNVESGGRVVVVGVPVA